MIAGALSNVSAEVQAQTVAHDHRARAAQRVEAHGASPEMGQSAFAAVQDVVRQLDADPATDWSKVNIEQLRTHLIDMDEVAMNARVVAEVLPTGVRLVVTGEGRAREAIRRLVLAHARASGPEIGYSLRAETHPEGAVLIAEGRFERDVLRVRALGLLGLLSEGDHHAPHHVMMARGGDPHREH